MGGVSLFEMWHLGFWMHSTDESAGLVAVFGRGLKKNCQKDLTNSENLENMINTAANAGVAQW